MVFKGGGDAKIRGGIQFLERVHFRMTSFYGVHNMAISIV